MLDIAGVDPSYNNMCKSIQTLFSSVYNIDIDFTDKKNLAAFLINVCISIISNHFGSDPDTKNEIIKPMITIGSCKTIKDKLPKNAVKCESDAFYPVKLENKGKGGYVMHPIDYEVYVVKTKSHSSEIIATDFWDFYVGCDYLEIPDGETIFQHLHYISRRELISEA